MIPVLPLDAFIRSVSVNDQAGHTLFLGAGASISSNILSAVECIWVWKQSIFLTNNPGLEDNFKELSLPSVKGRIQQWLNSKGYPSEGSSEEYGYYVEKCYPLAKDRQAFFQKLAQRAQLNSGYRLAALLAQEGIFRSFWTTNFDGLIAKSLANSRVTTIEVSLDTANRIARIDREGEVRCISLHGDYRYDSLKNTSDELKEQDKTLRQELVGKAQNSSLIVMGYSGRDLSVMTALEEGYRMQGPGVLYWCGYGDTPTEPVKKLLEVAKAAGRTAFYVPGVSFDDVMRRLALATLKGDNLDTANAIIHEVAQALPAPPFSAPEGSIGAILKSTAFRLRCPTDVYNFTPSNMPKTQKVLWSWVRERVGERNDLVAVPFKGSLWAFGSLTSIREVFGQMTQEIVRVPLDTGELRFEDGPITHLLLTGLVKAIANSQGLSSEKSQIWDGHNSRKERLGSKEFKVCEALLFFIRKLGSDVMLVMKPTLKLFNLNGSPASPEEEKAIKLVKLGYQHNDKFNETIERWRRHLFKQTEFTFPVEDSDGFKFIVDRAPVVAAIVAQSGDNQAPAMALSKATQRGFKVAEPSLRFASPSGVGRPQDVHPIRGLLSNRPFDFGLTSSGFVTEVRLGVLCPAPESRSVTVKLSALDQPANPSNTEQDYLLPYPGFQKAFGLPLNIPKPGDADWKVPVEPPENASKEKGARAVAESLISGLEELRATSRTNVILIITPLRWSQWRSYENDSEHFDLHDFIKAYAARRGIATQFIDEDTLGDPQVCRIRWWLSLALYTKSFRTPFVLDGIRTDTAFVGFGTSIDRHGPEGQKVVLGCSHIFNEEGQGLQYRLSKVEKPFFDSRRRNAFLSKDDARRVGESIRQLFFEARGELPKRVVIHKRTEFRRDEREGLLEGLQGIKAIDMIEIRVDDAFRYLSSKIKNGEIHPDGFPVARGTVIPVTDDEAFLWVHGSAAAVKNGWKYYQGKRRIPAPLFLKRHSGATDLETLAKEILGFSKMNWNTFDLYTQLPATLDTSGRIARIGRLMEGYGNANYDYRLLM